MSYTPRYVVNLTKFRDNCYDIINPFVKEWGTNLQFGYSVKTNRDKELITYAKTMLKWNIEVVSPDEYFYVKSLGICEEDIILNGPCKIDMIHSDLKLPAVINLDNLMEVKCFVSTFPNYDGKVGLRINFDLEAKCPQETIAGSEVSRFGIDSASAEFIECIYLLRDSGIKNIGLHLHTSTKTRSINVFTELAKEAVRLKRVTGEDFSFIDIGGGFFGGQKVTGKPSMNEYATSICSLLKSTYDPNRTVLILEPGASVLSTCVTYETRVINKRVIRGVNVLTVDGTLLHINPFMSKRRQPFELLGNDKSVRRTIPKQIIGGATCMENDRLAVIENDKELYTGDVLVFKYR